jgi:hypothetical protein
MIIYEEEGSIDQGLRLAACRSFAEIPGEWKTPEKASSWLMMQKTLGAGRFAECFEQIPRAFLSQDLLKFAVQSDARLLAKIDPEDSSDYAELCLAGYNLNYLAAHYFHEDFRTTKTVGLLVRSLLGFHKAFDEVPWISKVITPDQIEIASLNNSLFMVGLPVEQISDAALKEHITRYGDFLLLRYRRKLHLGAKHLKTGFWPEPQGSFEARHSKPKNLNSAFDHAVSGRYPVDVQALFMANLMTYPIEDVMALVQTTQHAALAMDMYSAKELRPFMNTNRHLKAALLEESLGL